MSGLVALRCARGARKDGVEILRAVAFDTQTANYTPGLRVTGIGQFATQTAVFGSNSLNGLTITIGSKTYTFQDTLTNVDGNVDVGANAEGSIDNLVAAVNLAAGAGTAYAAATTVHPTVTAVKAAADTIRFTAKTAGVAGNAIGLSETGSAITATGANLAGGIDPSGATGVIAEQSDGGTSGTLILRDMVGEFADNELITDSSTGSALRAGSASTIPLLTPSDALILQADGVDMGRAEAHELIRHLREKIIEMDWHADNGLFALRVNRGEGSHQVERLGSLGFDGQSTSFTVGHLITGGTSGATGTLVEQTDAGATGTLILNEPRGIFENNDALTDEGSGDGDATGAQGIPLLTPDDAFILQVDGVDMTKAEALEALRQIELAFLDMAWPAAA